MSEPLYLAKSEDGFPALLPQMANRHGLITGATGTGKTVTLQSMAERLSYAGVPVFMADVKGDLSGAGAPGVLTPKLETRIKELGLEGFTPFANPVAFWDVFGVSGTPVRATVSDMGPLLLARLLNLNETQTGVLQLVFKIADDQGLLLLDLKDLRAMVQHVGDNAKTFTTEYGNVSSASIGAIQRGLLTLDEQGGDVFFGEPMLDIADLMQVDRNGRGVINVLAAEKLVHAPALYSTFLLWLLSELFEQLPEAGDLEKPKLVFFFDEAHLLFSDAPQALTDKVEQVVRLIRSKGVGVYFVTQNPLDVPEKILGQLGNRVQHALRAFTPRDQKAVQAAAAQRAPVVVAGPDCSYEPFASEQPTNCGKLLSDLAGAGVPYSLAAANELSLSVAGTAQVLDSYPWSQKAERTVQLQAWLTAAGYDFAKVKPSPMQIALVVGGLVLMMALSGATYGPVAALLTEMFPARIRYSSMSIPYHIGTGYFGGFLPLIASYIVAKTGNPYSGLWYTWVVVAVALVVALWGLKGGVPREFSDDAS